MSRRFPTQRIVITGAGSGLGRAIALRFARAGWQVAVTDRDAARASDVLAEIDATDGSGLAATCNVRSAEELQALADRLEADWGGVDVIVNNAGVASAGTVIDTSLEDWDWMLDINLMGVARGCHVLGPLLVRQGYGHIVNIASFAGIANAPAMAAYNTAKCGVIGLSETLRAEMAAHSVGVSVVCPAFFRTNLLESFRTPDPRLLTFAEKMFERSNVSADDVASDIFNAVMRNRFMVITHRDARWLYRLKRLAPEQFFKILRNQAAALADKHARSKQ